MSNGPKKRSSRLRVLSSGDPKTAFHTNIAAEILALYGLPKCLLSTSKKAKKCGRVGVLNKVLYLTPGVFCPAATTGCLESCLGHTSGMMQLPSSTIARDRRTALYIENEALFMRMLRVEIEQVRESARRLELIPAIRLNGTSDIPWERFHSELFDEFSDVQFFDYTKLRVRMKHFIASRSDGRNWPANYHLTFSADGTDRISASEILSLGGNVAVVFHPTLPSVWWDSSVIDGDQHDARFLDKKGVIVGLRAKGIARVDTSGFVVRPCSICQSKAPQCELAADEDATHRTLRHICSRCGASHKARWMLPHALKQTAKAA